MTTQTEDGAARTPREILTAAGMTMADVVSSRVFITDTAMFQDMNAATAPAFPPTRRPAPR